MKYLLILRFSGVFACLLLLFFFISFSAIAQKGLPSKTPTDADGILFTPDNQLMLSQNKGMNRISELVSNDNRQSAKVIAVTSAEDRFA